MMELKIASRSLTDEAGKLRRLHYFLLVDELEAGSFFCEQYGVKIAEEDGDCAQIRGITTSAVRIDELMTTLVEQQVSPTVLEMWCRTGCDRDTGQHIPRLPLRETLLFFLSPVVDALHQRHQQSDGAQDHKDAQHSLPHHFQSMRNIFHVRMSSFLLHHRMGLLAKY